MVDARIGFCCTFVSPSGDEAEQRLLNMQQPTIASIARLEPSEGSKRLEDVVRYNLDTLDRQIAFVASLPPLERLFRILSGFLIGWSHPALKEQWTTTLRKEVCERLADAGSAAREKGVRLSMHPAQHAILATNNPAALANAVHDIEEHAAIFEMLGFGGGWHPHGASVNVHGGAKAAGLDSLKEGLHGLSAAARNLVTIENDELSFGLDELLTVADEVAIVVDFHHHWVHSRGEWLMPNDPRVAAIERSWRGVRPLTHISVSREVLLDGHDPDALPDFGALSAAGLNASKLRGHSDRMWNRAVNRLVERHLSWADVEVEAKAKNLASTDLADHVRSAADMAA
jgi:UV DNA damage repair endonuclease